MPTTETLPSAMPDVLARKAVASLSLVQFVTHWNLGNGSKIGSWADFDLALWFEPELDRSVDLCRFEAAANGVAVEFDAALRSLLEPVIHESCVAGLRDMCEAWARGIANCSPRTINLPVPFRSVTEWAIWCLGAFEQPPICGPYGEDIMPPDQERRMLLDALMAQGDRATRRGWITAPRRGTTRQRLH